MNLVIVQQKLMINTSLCDIINFTASSCGIHEFLLTFSLTILQYKVFL